MPKKEKLSQSLQSLLGGVIGIESNTEQEAVIRLSPEDIIPNDYQPRSVFNEEALSGLVESIQAHGILQPVVVTPISHGYMLIAGERRWRAAKKIGLKEVPAIVRHIEDVKMLEIALIENIQREDLNSIEKALGFQELINKFGLTQEQVAKAMGKNRSSVANFLRLLDLPQEIQDTVSRGTLSMGHARALLSVQNKSTQLRLCEKIIEEGLSVREVEAITSAEKKQEKPGTSPPKITASPQILDLEDRLRKFFGTKVSIQEKGGKGKITISFHNNDEFVRIANTLGIHP